jgi:hypothetical protein
MGETRNEHRISAAMLFRSWENNIKIDLMDRRWKVVATDSGSCPMAGLGIS